MGPVPDNVATPPSLSNPEIGSEKEHALGISHSHDEKTAQGERELLEAIKHGKHVVNWDGSGVDFSQVDEKKTLRKMDSRLIPVLAVLYLLSFLDRG